MKNNSSSDNPSTNSSKKPGSQIIVDTLLEQGVEVMFGYTGGVVLPFFDKLYDAPIRFIIPRHEQGGCHMADGYARASGKPGVVEMRFDLFDLNGGMIVAKVVYPESDQRHKLPTLLRLEG